MLNGIDPIIIFSFRKLIPGILDVANKIPIVADSASTSFPLPLIPIYLSEKLTGIYIDSESKSIEIDTTPETKTDGSEPTFYQKALSSNVKIQMVASRNSLGVSLLSAMADLIIPKVTSKEYSITYLHGAVTVFSGLLHSFNIDQSSDNDLYRISLELVKPPPGGLKALAPVVVKVTGTVPL